MKFEIGDTIKIIDTGQLYSSYTEMAKKLGADVGGKWKPRAIHERNFKNGELGLILNIGKRQNHILIEMDLGDQLRMSRLGIEKVNIILPDSMFEI